MTIPLARILVTDDDPLVLGATVRLLTSAGYEVVSAMNGKQTLQLIEEHHPDMLLLDATLPDIEGAEIYRHIKADARTADIFVVLLLEARSDSDEESDALECNADSYITRPFANREFLARIQAYRRIQTAEQKVTEYVRRLEKEAAERKQAEDAAKNSEKRFRALVENSRDAITLLDVTGIVVYDSPAAAGMLGYAPEDWIGQDVFVLIHPDDLPQIRYSFQHLAETPDARIEHTFRVHHKSGTWLWVEMAATNWLTKPGVNAIVLNYHDITERKQAEEQLRFLYEASQRLNQTLDMQEIYQAICDFMSIVAPNDGLAISAFDAEKKRITYQAYWMDNKWMDVSSFPAIPLEEEGRGTQSTAIRTGQAMLLNDYQAQVRPSQTASSINEDARVAEILPDEEITRSALIVPLKIRGRVSGVIQVLSYRLNAYTDDQLKLLEALALHIASAEQNALLYAQVQAELNERKRAEQEMVHRMSELEMLYDSGLALNQLLSPKEIGQKIIELLEQKMDWHHTVIRLQNPQKDVLESLVFSYPSLDDEKQQREIQELYNNSISRPGQGLTGWAIQNSQIVRSSNVSNDPRYIETFPGIHSGLYVPIKSRQGVIGVISIESSEFNAFSNEDERLVATLANQAAVAIENARLTTGLEQRVKERTAEVQDLYNNAPIGYHSLDESGTIIMINQTELDWFGYARDEVVGVKKFRALLTPQSQHIFDESFPRFKSQGQVKDLEFEVIRKDGSTFPALINATTIHDANGKYLHSRSTLSDITARKRAEDTARKLSQAVEHSPTSVLITNRDSIIEYVNPMFCEVTGYTLEDVVGKTPRILKSGIHPPEFYRNMWATLLAGNPWYGELYNKRKNGELFWEYASIAPIKNEYGETTHYVAVREDVTERKKAEEALHESRDALSIANASLEKAAKLKDEFLASMSHELRTPLTGILGLAEALQMKVYGELNEKQIMVISTVQESGRHLLDLINDILDLSKIEAGKLELQFSPCSIADICEASLQLTKGMAHQKKQNVSYMPLSEPVLIRADVRRLKQILVNLLSNAVKFTQEGGELGLEVQARESERVVKMIIWDKGIGIKPEGLAKLFKPFTQLDSSLAREYAGTGLGLSLVKRLTEMHNGGIQVESVFGEGSRFTVTLPWSPQNTTPIPYVQYRNNAKGTEPLITPNRANSATILVSDDNEIVLQMIADFLESKQYYVIKARNGFELLDLAAEFHPKVILADIQMPGLDGLEAIRRIRAHSDPLIAAAGVIAITAMAMPGDRELCLRAGANEYMSKPVQLKELAATIQKQIGKNA